MNELNRIKDIINKINNNSFVIKEQSLAGDLWDLGAGAIGGLYDAIKSGISDGVPYLVDKVKGVKILKPSPFSGNCETVSLSAAKMFKASLTGTVDSKTDVYNSLMILKNIVDGAENGGIVDGENNPMPTWEVLETFTGALFYELQGRQFSYDKLWSEYIEEDDIDDCAEYVSEYIEKNINYNATIGPIGEDIKNFMVEFFLSGKEVYYINTDRLSNDWNVGEIQVHIDKINMADYEDDGRVMSDFEVKLSSELPCYETAKLVFLKTEGSDLINIAAKQEGRWTTIFFFKNNKLTANVYFDGIDKDPVATTTTFDCGDGVEQGQTINPVGINESLIVEQNTTTKYVTYGKLRIGFDSETFEKLRVLHNGGSKQSSADNDTETSTEEPTTTQTTTQQPDSNQNDTGGDEEVVAKPEEKTNVQRLIDLLISKGVDEYFAKSEKYRASMGSVSVGALMGETITSQDYLNDEENLYAEKFIESIEKGITTFKRNETNHDKEAKEEERIINTTTKISNPTELELKKIEEVGDDAVAKTKNELSFDKNRIKMVRVTSNDSKVVYVAKEDITDLISTIEGQLEKVFGGDWKLDKAKNKFMSSNKLFIFSKKEQ